MTAHFSPPRLWARKLSQLWLLPLCLLAGTGAANAATINVPADQPTIQAAINASSNGDTVLIADGTYTGTGNVDVDFGGKNITVTSQHGATSTIINCQGSSGTNHRGFYVHSGETSAVINGLTLKNGYETSTYGGGIYINGTTAIVSNCTFTHDTAHLGGGIFGGGTSTITNCTFTGNTASYGGGIFNSGRATITNCTLTGNTAPSPFDGGIYDESSTILINDILYGDTGGEIGGISQTATYCDIQGGYAGTGNIDADPLFVSASDLHLQASSPCLGMGTQSGAPATDIAGTTRPNPPSIGAYDIAAMVTSITASPTSATLPSGDTQQIAVTAYYSDGTSHTVSNSTFSSDTPSVATVSDTGLVTAVASSGTATITASEGGQTATVVITVAAPTLESLAVTPSTASVVASQTQQFMATATYSDGSTPDETNSATWTSSDNTVATVDSTGLVTTLAAGTVTITATIPGTAPATASLTVMAHVSPQYVSPSGNDSNDGSQGSPKLTIQAAINAAIDGDTVIIEDGTYTGPGNVDNDFSGKNITVTSQNGAAATIIDCGGSSNADHRGFILDSGETAAVINGLTIENGYDSNAGGGIYNFSALTITNCAFIGNTAPGRYGGGIYNSDIATVTNCTFTGNAAGHGGGIDNEGIMTVTNCTFTGNTASGSGGGFYNDSTATLTNDILYGDTGGELVDVNSATATYCDIQGGYAGTGNVDADPLFVSASDLHLQSTSPCLAAGTATGAPTTDIAGTARPTPPSIGAYDIAAATVTSLTVSPAAATLTQGQTLPLIVTAHLSDGTSHVVTDSTFASDTPAVATVSSSGLVTAVTSNGTATITVNEGGHTAAAVITAGPPAGYEALWTNPDGEFSVWQAALGGGFAPHDFDAVPGFNVQAIADTPDGHAHLLLIAADGSINLADAQVATLGRFHNSAALTPYGPFPGWTAQTLAAGPDGSVRVLWTNTSGALSLWKVHTDGSYDCWNYGPFPGWTARLLSAAPDNTLRVLWTHTSGQVSFWVMDASGGYRDFEYGPYPGWTVSALATGPDGQSHLTWNHAGDNVVSVWSLSDGGVFTYADYGPFGGWTAGSLAVGADGTLHLGWSLPDGTGSLWDLSATDPSSFTDAVYGPYGPWRLHCLAAAP